VSSPRPVSTDSSRTNAVAPAGTSAPAAERNAAPTLNERLENLPFTRAHGKLLGRTARLPFLGRSGSGSGTSRGIHPDF